MSNHTIKLELKTNYKKKTGFRFYIASLLVVLAEKIAKTEIDVEITEV